MSIDRPSLCPPEAFEFFPPNRHKLSWHGHEAVTLPTYTRGHEPEAHDVRGGHPDNRRVREYERRHRHADNPDSEWNWV